MNNIHTMFSTSPHVCCVCLASAILVKRVQHIKAISQPQFATWQGGTSADGSDKEPFVNKVDSKKNPPMLLENPSSGERKETDSLESLHSIFHSRQHCRHRSIARPQKHNSVSQLSHFRCIFAWNTSHARLSWQLSVKCMYACANALVRTRCREWPGLLHSPQ